MTQLMTEAPPAQTALTRPIVFFDGVCGMCNFFVNVLLRIDRRQVFLIAPLQGETAARLLPPLSAKPEEWSMIVLDEKGKVFDQSDASLEVYRRLGGLWWLLSLARFVPRFIRNPAYRVIARNRYRWFGHRDQCRIPTPEEKARFLP
jgi:predicted DCC family thiol-disulfide oxidoreductase YuxK